MMKPALTIVLIVAAFAVVAVHAHVAGLLAGKPAVQCKPVQVIEFIPLKGSL